MKEIVIDSWAEFQQTVEPQFYREWMYRGQSNSMWKLESSLFRILKKNQNIRNYNKRRTINLIKENYESEIINHFMKSSHLYLSSVPDKENYQNIEHKYKTIMETQKEIDETLLLPFEPGFTNARLQAQQGAFLIPNTLNYSHDEILEHYKNDNFIIKLIINIKNIYEMFEALFKMNISYTNLFPGLEGFCKSFESIGIIPINRLKPISQMNI